MKEKISLPLDGVIHGLTWVWVWPNSKENYKNNIIKSELYRFFSTSNKYYISEQIYLNIVNKITSRFTRYQLNELKNYMITGVFKSRTLTKKSFIDLFLLMNYPKNIELEQYEFPWEHVSDFYGEGYY